MNERRIYMDNAAMTPVDERVIEEMVPYFGREYGNPSSIHWHGRNSRAVIDKARARIAHVLNCRDSEIYFTGGGTESDNLAIKGLVESFKKHEARSMSLDFARDKNHEKPHIITTTIEHHAVFNCCKQLENEGCDVTYVGVDESGIVKVRDIEKAIKDNTVLVSVMYANNEVGTIQPVGEIAQLLKQKNVKRSKNGLGKIYFHTDACQAAGYLEMDVEKLGVDLLSINGSKIYGPAGIGILYIKRGLQIKPLVYGGEQEMGMRPGTENTSAIAGMAKAMELAQVGKEKENKRLLGLRDRLMAGVNSKIDHIKVNGDLQDRLPGNLNISVAGIEGESMILMLDEAGVSISTGSACTSNALEPSHVLVAMGVSDEAAHGSLRISLGRFTTKDEVDYFVRTLPAIVAKLRDMSPMKIGK